MDVASPETPATASAALGQRTRQVGAVLGGVPQLCDILALLAETLCGLLGIRAKTAPRLLPCLGAPVARGDLRIGEILFDRCHRSALNRMGFREHRIPAETPTAKTTRITARGHHVRNIGARQAAETRNSDTRSCGLV